jgi:hypothetical protein
LELFRLISFWNELASVVTSSQFRRPHNLYILSHASV